MLKNLSHSADGTDQSDSLPRNTTLAGDALPSARNVSKFMTSYAEATKPDEANLFSVLMMQIGQFLDHDVAHTPAPLDGGFFATGKIT